jgi:tripartite ATP-independent transporter DctM subunit
MISIESIFPFLMFFGLLLAISSGYPVALALSGTGIVFGAMGHLLGLFSFSDFEFLPSRIWGVMNNVTLAAVPLFVAMGFVLQRSRIAEEVLTTCMQLMARRRGALAYAVLLVGSVLAATTGIVGATVVTLAVLALPTMLENGYDRRISTGIIAASGTLGQVIPPSIVLILLGDLMGVDVGDLFMGALIPGLMLVVGYALYIAFLSRVAPEQLGRAHDSSKNTSTSKVLRDLLKSFVPPVLLMILVLGSILFGIATPTESAACGLAGALLIALIKRRLSAQDLWQIGRQTTFVTAMVFFVLIGAQFFAIVFRGSNGEEVILDLVRSQTLEPLAMLLMINLLLFVLGFFLDFLEICFIMIPILVPILTVMQVDKLWMAVIFALNLQTSFLTPPFGFSLFYLKGSAPKEVRTGDIYRGVVPFICIQVVVIILVASWKPLVLWLPSKMAG